MQVKKQFYFKTRYYIRNSQYIYFKTKTEHRYIDSTSHGPNFSLSMGQLYIDPCIHIVLQLVCGWIDLHRFDLIACRIWLQFPCRRVTRTREPRPPPIIAARPPASPLHCTYRRTYVRTHRKSLKIRTYSWWSLLA